MGELKGLYQPLFLQIAQFTLVSKCYGIFQLLQGVAVVVEALYPAYILFFRDLVSCLGCLGQRCLFQSNIHAWFAAGQLVASAAQQQL